MSADSLADAILNLSRQLAESLRSGNALVSEARGLEVTIREAEGWLLAARRELDPEDPLGKEPAGVEPS